MKQLILPVEYNGEPVYSLDSRDSHYLIHVKRLVIGNTIQLKDHKGCEYSGKIVDTNASICTLEITSLSGAKKLEREEIILIQCIPKGKKIDLVIRQAVESGVSKIIPVMSENSIPVYKDNRDKIKKQSRWEAIVKEALQQSGSPVVSSVTKPSSFKEALAELPENITGIFFHQVPNGGNKSLHKILDKEGEPVVLVVGPEGGLSPKEVDFLLKEGFTPALLGDTILRAETAAIFGIGAVKMILAERDNWKIK